MRIRAATFEDIDAMVTLEKHVATAAHWTHAQYEQIFADSTIRRRAFLMEEPPAIHGFLIAQAIGPEWLIENIAVAGAARRRGLGTRLVGEFLQVAQAGGAAAVFLEVRESNVAARALYEKWAFEKAGRRANYYSNPVEAAIVYRLSFV